MLSGLWSRKEDEERALCQRSGQHRQRQGVQLQSAAAGQRGVQHGAVCDQLVLHRLVQLGESRDAQGWGVRALHTNPRHDLPLCPLGSARRSVAPGCRRGRCCASPRGESERGETEATVSGINQQRWRPATGVPAWQPPCGTAAPGHRYDGPKCYKCKKSNTSI